VPEHPLDRRDGRAVKTAPTTVEVPIREAATQDAPQLAELTTQLGYPVKADAMRARLERLVGRSDDVVLVAVDGHDAPIGWIHVAMLALLEHSDYASINGLVVDEAHRSRGIGQALVAAAEAWARDRGAAQLTVRSRSTRQRAHRFYERLGYAQVKLSHVFAKPLV
jgi:ribosomal protein S18 acetylase RimI-like enzyme